MAQIVTLDNLPNGTFSSSGYDCARGCGEKWRRQYILKEQQAPAMPLIVGNAVHGPLGLSALEQLSGRPRLSMDKLLEHGANSFRYQREKAEARAKMPVELKEGETIDQFAFDVKRCLATFEPQVGHTLQPVEVEREFYYQPPGRPYTIKGYIDIYDKLGFLRDYKTSRARLNPVAAVASDQLTIYQAHLEDGGKPVNGLILHGIIMLKDEVVIQTIEAPPRTPAQIEECLCNIDNTVRMINAGIFLKANDIKGMCGYCGFIQWCRPEVFEAKKIATAEAVAAKKLEKEAAAAELKRLKDAEKEAKKADKKT